MKKTSRLSDLRVMTDDQLDDEALKLKKEQFNLRFQKATGQLREHGAGARGPPRHRARQDHRRAEARRRQGRRTEETNAEDEFCRASSSATRRTRRVVVKVERRFTHPLLKKTVRRSKNYHAHDENKTPQGRRHGLDRGDAADLEAEALARHRRGGGRMSVEIHPGGGEPPSGEVRTLVSGRKPI